MVAQKGNTSVHGDLLSSLVRRRASTVLVDNAGLDEGESTRFGVIVSLQLHQNTTKGNGTDGFEPVRQADGLSDNPKQIKRILTAPNSEYLYLPIGFHRIDKARVDHVDANYRYLF